MGGQLVRWFALALEYSLPAAWAHDLKLGAVAIFGVLCCDRLGRCDAIGDTHLRLLPKANPRARGERGGCGAEWRGARRLSSHGLHLGTTERAEGGEGVEMFGGG